MGEFGLIKHLTQDIKPVQPSTKKAVGDDCAVMDFNVVESRKSKVESRLMLHAAEIAFVHPITKEEMHFCSDFLA